MEHLDEEGEDYEDPQRPPNCHHYEASKQVPKDIKKYWTQRYTIFSLYDEGVWLTDAAWYGVTPEPIADKISEHIVHSAPKSKKILIDAFAGVGGNAIAFARSGHWDQIFAIEKDPDVLACAKHNAVIYGVDKLIWWIEGDCFDVLKKRLAGVAKNAVIFASPPWGGPGYTHDQVFCLSTMQPYDLQTLYRAFDKASKDFVLYLPRTSDLNEIADAASDRDGVIPVKHYCIRGSSKALCAYFGDFELD